MKKHLDLYVGVTFIIIGAYLGFTVVRDHFAKKQKQIDQNTAVIEQQRKADSALVHDYQEALSEFMKKNPKAANQFMQIMEDKNIH